MGMGGVEKKQRRDDAAHQAVRQPPVRRLRDQERKPANEGRAHRCQRKEPPGKLNKLEKRQLLPHKLGHIAREKES
jgi:hypothetical protein